MFEPDFEAFAEAMRPGEPVLVCARRSSRDLETPVAAFLKLRHGRDGTAFLLESVEGGAARGRYSMIGLDPDLDLALPDGARRRSTAARSPSRDAFEPCRAPAARRLRALIAESAMPRRADEPAADGGRAVRLSRLRHGAPDGAPAARRTPDALGVPDAMLIRPTRDGRVRRRARRDHRRSRRCARSPAPSRARPPTRAALSRLDARRRRARTPARPRRSRQPIRAARAASRRSRTPRQTEFIGMVAQAKEYIRAGDIFQVVLSQRFEAPFTLPAFALYRALRRVNPAPFLCYLDFGGFPDRLLQPGNPGARARRQGHDPPDRRHAPARRDAGRGPGARPTSCWPIRRSAPSI